MDANSSLAIRMLTQEKKDKDTLFSTQFILHTLHTLHIPCEALVCTIASCFQLIMSAHTVFSQQVLSQSARTEFPQLQSTGPWKMSLMWPCSPVNQVPQKGQAA